jgi:hypothetical protein
VNSLFGLFIYAVCADAHTKKFYLNEGENTMKKRILSMLLAAVMVATLIPVVTVPATANTTSHSVRLAVLTAETWTEWTSEPVVVNGPGTYPATINIPANAALGVVTHLSLITALENSNDRPLSETNFDFANDDGDGEKVPSAWEDYGLRFDSVTFNDTVQAASGYENYFRRRERGGTPAIIGYVYADLWNAWYTPANTLTGGIVERIGRDVPAIDAGNADTVNFGLEGGAPITKIHVTFTVFDATSRDGELEAQTDSADIRLAARYLGATNEDVLITYGDVITVDKDEEYTVNIDFAGGGTRGIVDLAIRSDGADFSPLAPFIGKANPAPRSWAEGTGVHLQISKIEVNSTALPAPKRWTKLCTLQPASATERAVNSNLVVLEPQFTGTFSQSQGYVDVALWNAWFANSQNLNGGGTLIMNPDRDEGTAAELAFRASAGNITSLSVTFTVHGIDEEVDECDCENEESDVKGTGLVLQERSGATKPIVGDALQVLRYLVGLSSEIKDANKGDAAWNAALITADSQTNDKPAVGDALQILRYLVNLSHVLVDAEGKPLT